MQNFWTDVILLQPLPYPCAKSKMHTQAYRWLRGVNGPEWNPSEGGEGRKIVTATTLSSCRPRGLCCCYSPVWAAFWPDFCYLGLCSNIIAPEKPSLTSPEIESQKPSHSLILILLYFLLSTHLPLKSCPVFLYLFFSSVHMPVSVRAGAGRSLYLHPQQVQSCVISIGEIKQIKHYNDCFSFHGRKINWMGKITNRTYHARNII